MHQIHAVACLPEQGPEALPLDGVMVFAVPALKRREANVECVLFMDALPEVGNVRRLPVVVVQLRFPLHDALTIDLLLLLTLLQVIAILSDLRLLVPRVLRVAEPGLFFLITGHPVQ